MNLVFGADQAVAEWVCERVAHVGGAASLGQSVAIGVTDGNDLLAGCVYHNWIEQYGNIEITFAAASPRFATRGVIRELLAYPFLQWECRRVSLVVPHDAKRTAKFVTGLGFVREGCVRHFFAPKHHALIFGMLRKEFDAMFRRDARAVR